MLLLIKPIGPVWPFGMFSGSVCRPESKQALRDPVAGCLAVVEQLEVYLLLADQVKFAALCEGFQVCILLFQGADFGTEFFDFPGIPEIND